MRRTLLRVQFGLSSSQKSALHEIQGALPVHPPTPTWQGKIGMERRSSRNASAKFQRRESEALLESGITAPRHRAVAQQPVGWRYPSLQITDAGSTCWRAGG